jgi:speckle-type POZ protein
MADRTDGLFVGPRQATSSQGGDRRPPAREVSLALSPSQHLLVAADRYNMERLKLMCEDKLCKYIDVGTVATVLTLAEQHQCSGLKKACFSFLKSREHLKAVVSGDGFKHLSRSCPAVMEELVAMLSS